MAYEDTSSSAFLCCFLNPEGEEKIFSKEFSHRPIRYDVQEFLSRQYYRFTDELFDQVNELPSRKYYTLTLYSKKHYCWAGEWYSLGYFTKATASSFSSSEKKILWGCGILIIAIIVVLVMLTFALK